MTISSTNLGEFRLICTIRDSSNKFNSFNNIIFINKFLFNYIIVKIYDNKSNM